MPISIKLLPQGASDNRVAAAAHGKTVSGGISATDMFPILIATTPAMAHGVWGSSRVHTPAQPPGKLAARCMYKRMKY